MNPTRSDLNSLISRYVSKLKGEDYVIDSRIPASYVLSTVLERGVMRIRGYARFPLRTDKPFVGRGVRLRATGLLQVGPGVTFGHGSFVDAVGYEGVTLGSNTSLGKNTRIEVTGRITTLGRGIRVGSNVGLGADCFYGCSGGIEIGDDTIIGNFVSFHAENHVISDEHRPIREQGVTHEGITVGRGCWIGAKATILDGARIGDGVVIAAGSVVTKGAYESWSIYGGAPARLLRSRTAETTSLTSDEL